jgi:predicted acyl esterase
MRDGINLYADIYHPDTNENPAHPFSRPTGDWLDTSGDQKFQQCFLCMQAIFRFLPDH